MINWRSRYLAHGIDGLHDEHRSGRPWTLERYKLITTTLTLPPRKYVVKQWSSRLLADHLGITRGAVSKAWSEYGDQPWRAETFKFSTDPELAGKVTGIVGVHMNPPYSLHRAMSSPGSASPPGCAVPLTAQLVTPNSQAQWLRRLVAAVQHHTLMNYGQDPHSTPGTPLSANSIALPVDCCDWVVL